MKGIKVILSIVFILSFSGAAMANIINVPDDQPTIQQGINAAQNGDTVLVQRGVYVENINFSGKNIVVGSLFLITQDTTYISQTIIDGNQNGSVVTFENSENATALLSGFTIINGTGSYVDLLGNGVYYNIGGGICCIWNSNSSIDNIMISENYAEHGGGGIFCFESNPSIKNVKIYNNSTGSIGSGGGICCIMNSDPTIENVLILFNSAYVSGGICCDESSPSLKNVKIINNSGGNNGGGIGCYNNSNMSMNNVMVVCNSAEFGGGIYSGSNSNLSLVCVTISGNSAIYLGGGINLTDSNPTLVNVTISHNSTNNGGGGIACTDNSNPELKNSILWDNSPHEIYFDWYYQANTITMVYSNVKDGEAGIVTNNNGTVYWLEGNIDADPLFADPENGDFHLTWTNFPIPDSTKSPCIDTGDPNSPLDPDSTRTDMGAYYFDQSQQGIEETPILSARCILYQNYPNPFSPDKIGTTTISFNIHRRDTKNAEIRIYNIKGQIG